LTLAEVEVFSDGHNVARRCKASQKNTAHGGDAGKAIDGNRSGNYGNGGQTHTQESTDNPWWEVDLGGDLPIDSIAVWNRTDGSLGNRLDGFTLKVLDGDRTVVFEKKGVPAPPEKVAFEVSGDAPERVVRRAAMLALTSVRGQEAATFKALARFVKEGDRQAAIRALQRIPTTYWPKEEAKPLLETLLAQVRKVPVAERTSSAVLDSMQFADALASLLPLSEARQVRKELGELGVRVLRLATVPDQMLFDKERLVVKAGKPVEVVFENNDLMPHNFVVAQPGSLEEVGTLAEAQATQPGAAERHYVPASPKVMHASRLLQPRDAQRLAFTAPAKAGVYPYVCTYPGHWRRMYGALYVVEDLDEYLAEPEAYLAKHPLPIADDLLKFVRPRTEWKFDDLLSSVEQLDSGRSFANGKQLFSVATCVACHKMNGVGNEFGPDLTKVDAKLLKPAEILKDVLEPSFRIDDKYRTYVFELNSGKNVTGMILEETPTEWKVIENPLLKAQPLVLKKVDVAERTKSATSIMPKGLLDKLTREEILDLVAYVAARGDPKHKLFQGGHDHGHNHSEH
jgi:putative heme-binding domain-containing protein